MSQWSSSWPDKSIQSTPNVDTVWIENGPAIRQFTIKEGHKSYTFVGEIVGDLALDYDADTGWNIYHVPTLQLCSKLVPCGSFKHSNECNIVGLIGECNCEPIEEYMYEKEALLRWMAKVQTNYQTAWTMLRLLTPENYEGKGQSAKDIILKWCLSVKVE